MDPGDAGAFVVLHGADDIEFVAVTGVGIGDERDVDGACHSGGVGNHFGFGQQSEIRVAVPERGACAGHVDEGETGLGDEHRGQTVIGAGGGEHAGFAEEGAEFGGLVQGCISIDMAMLGGRQDCVPCLGSALIRCKLNVEQPGPATVP